MLTLQSYIEKLNDEFFENLIIEKIMKRYQNINETRIHNKRMLELRLRRKIWQRFILNLIAKVRHIDWCNDVFRYRHEKFDLKLFWIHLSVKYWWLRHLMYWSLY